jgi:hypothetical protein
MLLLLYKVLMGDCGTLGPTQAWKEACYLFVRKGKGMMV